MNRQFDVIVIGDSKAGNETVKNIATADRTIKIAFISCEFKSSTTRDFISVEYIKDEVIFTDYKNRLFGCYLKSGARHYCTHLIIASGLAYEPLIINNKHVPNVYNNIYNISKSAKNQPAIVIGGKNSDVKLALAVAKKYKQVYLCTESIELTDITMTNKKKLAAAKNIAVLPNASIIKFHTIDGALQTVELDNYSTVTCSAIFVKTAAKPETSFISNIISKDSDNFLVTTNLAQSSFIPRCFAVGNCARSSTKKMRAMMIETILNDFNGGNR